MYNYSGLLFRIWGVCGIVLLLGIVCILIEKPWVSTFKIQNCKLGLIIIAFSICLGFIYIMRIVSPNVSSYTGVYIDSHRDSRVAPPLPVTSEYTFGNSESKEEFYLDIFSKKKIFPFEFEEGKKYTIYYDNFTKVIVKVEEIE